MGYQREWQAHVFRWEERRYKDEDKSRKEVGFRVRLCMSVGDETHASLPHFPSQREGDRWTQFSGVKTKSLPRRNTKETSAVHTHTRACTPTNNEYTTRERALR